MAEVRDMVIHIRADASQALRTLRKVRRQLWWYQYGHVVVTIALFVLGFVIGLNLAP